MEKDQKFFLGWLEKINQLAKQHDNNIPLFLDALLLELTKYYPNGWCFGQIYADPDVHKTMQFPLLETFVITREMLLPGKPIPSTCYFFIRAAKEIYMNKDSLEKTITASGVLRLNTTGRKVRYNAYLCLFDAYKFTSSVKYWHFVVEHFKKNNFCIDFFKYNLCEYSSKTSLRCSIEEIKAGIVGFRLEHINLKFSSLCIK